MQRTGLSRFVWTAGLAAVLLAWAAGTRAADEGQAAAEQRPTEAMVYVPPPRGVPARRVGGGTRGDATASCAAELEALVPDGHAGLTTRSQPLLYWYVSADVDCRVDFTLNDPRRAEPLLEVTLTGPFRSGIQELRLADRDVELERGIRYEWSVALVQDPERRSKDIVAGGAVVRVDPPPGLGARTGGSEGLRAASAYAQEGIWYDALAGVSTELASRPADAKLQRSRAGLLEQVGLARAAAAERGALPGGVTR